MVARVDDSAVTTCAIAAAIDVALGDARTGGVLVMPGYLSPRPTIDLATRCIRLIVASITENTVSVGDGPVGLFSQADVGSSR